jgi:uncharacterized protein
LNSGGSDSDLSASHEPGNCELTPAAQSSNETLGVLRDKFQWDGYRLHFAGINLENLANVVTPRQSFNAVADPDDNKILECAVEAGSDCVVTSDTHLLTLREFRGIPIMTPEQFLDRGIQR